jgi:hypothetical protein
VTVRPAAVEPGPGPGGAAVPHAERLLLPSRGRGGPEPGGRGGRELLRRGADAACAGALLPDGRASGARRGRPRGDRLQRGGRPVPGGGRARRRRQRLRAHHGAQATHPRRRLHRRHIIVPTPRRPGKSSLLPPSPRYVGLRFRKNRVRRLVL